MVCSDTSNVLFRLGEVGLLDGVRLYDFLVFMLVFLGGLDFALGT